MIKLDSIMTAYGPMEIEVDPHEALKALEEQAPEVLREYTNKLTGKIKSRDKQIKNTQEELAITRKAYETVLRDNERLTDKLKESPWIKVSDQPPPKDGSWFFVRGKSTQVGQGYVYHVVRWVEGVEQWDIRYANYFSNFREDDEWMPIPE